MPVVIVLCPVSATSSDPTENDFGVQICPSDFGAQDDHSDSWLNQIGSRTVRNPSHGPESLLLGRDQNSNKMGCVPVGQFVRTGVNLPSWAPVRSSHKSCSQGGCSGGLIAWAKIDVATLGKSKAETV